MHKKSEKLELTVFQQIKAVLAIVAAGYGIWFILKGRLDIILDHPHDYGDLCLILLCAAGLLVIALHLWQLANHYCDTKLRESHKWVLVIWYPIVAICCCTAFAGVILGSASFFMFTGRSRYETKFCRFRWYFVLPIVTYGVAAVGLCLFGVNGRTKWQKFLLLDHPFFDTPYVPFWKKIFKKKHNTDLNH